MDKRDRKAELRQIVEDAFRDIPYPGDDNISSEDHCFECSDMARAFRGKHWKEITLDLLLKDCLGSGLPLFKPAALRFYLPAFILVSIDEFVEADTIPDVVLDLLTPEPAEPDSRFVAKFDPLARQQKRAVRLFIEYLLEEYGDHYPDDAPRLALDRYWGREW